MKNNKELSELQKQDISNSDIIESDIIDPEYDTEADSQNRESLFFRINWHIVLAAGFVIFIGLLVLWFFNYGHYIDRDSLDFLVGRDEIETRDSILPLTNDKDAVPIDDGITTIVAFGNAPFADDRNSSDSLANLIADLSGATIYNCSVADTYLAAVEKTFLSDKYPMDVFNFYWLTTLITLDNRIIFEQAFEAMGENTPEDALEVYQTLTNIDFELVDVITIMYDASDYLAGHEMYNDNNRTDILQFTGNMEAGIELIQEFYPHIRIIVMSPTYAFALDEEGNYVSSDKQRYGQDVLSTYVTKQFESAYYRCVSFVDHQLGTFTEDEAADYLTDHLHLNLRGRKAVAERFVYALNYYSDNK